MRNSSKSDLMNYSSYKNGANTTKEASSFDLYSNSSSQEMFMFKKLRDHSIEKKEITLDVFEKLLYSILAKLNCERTDQ